MKDWTAAEQHAKRYYRQDHFTNQVYAERAYFRVLVESLKRGQMIAHLSRLLGSARRRGRELRRVNRDLQRQLDEATATNAVRQSGDSRC